MLKTIRLIAWIGVAIASLIGGIVLVGALQDQARQGASLPGAARIGGDFVLTDQNGAAFSSDALKGQPYAVFFGFTHCPDICPTTLLEMTTLIDKLGPKADGLEVLFVSVDPERDTPELLEKYLSSFHPRIKGLTGTPEQIAKVARDYRIVFEKVPSGSDSDDYTMNHTATVYLFDEKGRLASTFAWGEDQAVQLRKLEKLVSG